MNALQKLEIEVGTFEAAKVSFNSVELKANLNQMLDEYKNAVVIKENEYLMKTHKANLNKLIKQIDSFRLETKKVLMKDITEFENECKELKALVESVTLPITAQLNELEELRKEEVTNVVLDLIDEAIADYELTNPTYSNELTVYDKYLNKTTSMKSIKDDIKNRAITAKHNQTMFENSKKMIELACANYPFEPKMDPEGWIALLETQGVENANNILEQIEYKIKERIQAEELRIQKAEEEAKIQTYVTIIEEASVELKLNANPYILRLKSGMSCNEILNSMRIDATPSPQQPSQSEFIDALQQKADTVQTATSAYVQPALTRTKLVVEFDLPSEEWVHSMTKAFSDQGIAHKIVSQELVQ